MQYLNNSGGGLAACILRLFRLPDPDKDETFLAETGVPRSVPALSNSFCCLTICEKKVWNISPTPKPVEQK